MRLGDPDRLGKRPLQLVIAGKRGWLTEAIERRAAELGGPNG
ncbi:MAG: hypothetical protein U0Z44_03260 [Kouleothrix sp.]